MLLYCAKLTLGVTWWWESDSSYTIIEIRDRLGLYSCFCSLTLERYAGSTRIKSLDVSSLKRNAEEQYQTSDLAGVSGGVILTRIERNMRRKEVDRASFERSKFPLRWFINEFVWFTHWNTKRSVCVYIIGSKLKRVGGRIGGTRPCRKRCCCSLLSARSLVSSICT